MGIAGLLRPLRRALLRRLRPLPPPHFRLIVHVAELPDVPAQLDADTIYVAGAQDLPKWAVLQCPCSRAHRITLSLQSGRSRWSVRPGRGAPTVGPSIDVRADVADGVRCHYWIRDGVVHWVPDWWLE